MFGLFFPTQTPVLVPDGVSTEDGLPVCAGISGCGDYAFGETTEWEAPRRYELGFRFEF